MTYDSKQNQTITELQQELHLVKRQIEKENGCPCVLVDPCQHSCTCANPAQSGGCKRCARYGSTSQRVSAAKRLVRHEQQRQEFKDQKWIDNYLDTKEVN